MQKVVTPAKAGIQENSNCFKILDSGFRRNDFIWVLATFYKSVLIDGLAKNPLYSNPLRSLPRFPW